MSKIVLSVLLMILVLTPCGWSQVSSRLLVVNKRKNTLAIVDPQGLKVIGREARTVMPSERCAYVAFIDADMMFTRTDWVQETLHQLQHFDVEMHVAPDYPTGRVVGLHKEFYLAARVGHVFMDRRCGRCLSIPCSREVQRSPS